MYNAEKKLHPLYAGAKHIAPAVWKKILPHLNHPYPPPPQTYHG